MADDLKSAERMGILSRISLELELQGLDDASDVSFKFNGKILSSSNLAEKQQFAFLNSKAEEGFHRLRYDLKETDVVKGLNNLQANIANEKQSASTSPVLKRVEMSIKYRDKVLLKGNFDHVSIGEVTFKT